MKDLMKKYWPFFSIILITVVFFWKFFLLGLTPIPADIVTSVSYPWRDYFLTSVHNPIISDAISFSFPMRILAVNLLKSGKLPLWNPYILFGNPLLANFQSAAFSPTNVFYFIFNNSIGWGLQIVTQHFLAFLFTYLLLKNWKISNFGSLVGGIIYAFSGFSIIWSPWNAHVLVAAFIPLLILLSDKFLSVGKWKYGLGAAIVLALQILSGYPQVVLYTLLALIIFWLFSYRKNLKNWTRSILFFTLIALGIGLSSFQILPGLELLKQSQRVAEPIPVEWAFMNGNEIIKFVSAEYFGNHVGGSFWGPKNYTSTVGFVGVIALTLSIIGLSKYKKYPQVKFLLGLVIFSLILSFKNPLSLFLWEKNILGLQAGVSWRIMVLFNLGVSVLAGIGIDNIDIKRKKLFLILLLSLVVLVIFAVYAFTLPLNNSNVALVGLLLPFGILIFGFLAFIFKSKIILVILLLIELFSFGWKYITFVSKDLIFPKTPLTDYLIKQKDDGRVNTNGVIPVNFNMIYRIEVPQGYDAVYPARTAKYLSVINSGNVESKAQDRYGLINENATSRLLDLGNVASILEINGKNKSPNFVYRSVSVIKNPKSLPRQFYVSDWVVKKDEKEILSKLLDPKFNISKTIVLEEDPPENTKGFIFVSDTWYPGWKAYVDGIESPVYKADYAFRAVAVPSSSSKIEFIYKPTSFYNGIWLSILSLFLILTLYPISHIAAKISSR